MVHPGMFTLVGSVITVIDILLQYLEDDAQRSARKVLARVLRFWFVMFSRIIVGGFFTKN